jgi:site-specific DNA-methyltransferase (adenine-specific)/modification methylase
MVVCCAELQSRTPVDETPEPQTKPESPAKPRKTKFKWSRRANAGIHLKSGPDHVPFFGLSREAVMEGWSVDRAEFEGGRIVLLCGDNRRFLHDYPDAAVVTDPPYGIGYSNGRSGAAVEGRKSLRRTPGTVEGDAVPFDPSALLGFPFVALFGANHFMQRLPEGGFLHAWDKTGGGRGLDDSFADVEFLWTNPKSVHASRRGLPNKTKKSCVFHYLWKGVAQDGEKGERRYHITQKPIAAMAWAIGFAPDDALILDPYMGAGSSALAALQLGRRYVGIELDPDHFEIACARMQYAIANRDGLWPEDDKATRTIDTVDGDGEPVRLRIYGERWLEAAKSRIVAKARQAESHDAAEGVGALSKVELVSEVATWIASDCEELGRAGG